MLLGKAPKELPRFCAWMMYRSPKRVREQVLATRIGRIVVFLDAPLLVRSPGREFSFLLPTYVLQLGLADQYAIFVSVLLDL